MATANPRQVLWSTCNQIVSSSLDQSPSTSMFADICVPQHLCRRQSMFATTMNCSPFAHSPTLTHSHMHVHTHHYYSTNLSQAAVCMKRTNTLAPSTHHVSSTESPSMFILHHKLLASNCLGQTCATDVVVVSHLKYSFYEDSQCLLCSLIFFSK